MLATSEKNRFEVYLLTLSFASILLLSFGTISQNVLAMGAGQGSCTNEYDGPITVAKINNGTQTFDPLANPGVTFQIPSQGNYYLLFIIHTPNQNNKGNSNPGEVWINTSLNGFYMGGCNSGSGPNQNYTYTLARSCSSGNNCVSPTFWGTSVNGFSYNMKFVTPSNTNNTNSNTIPNPPANITPIPVSTSQIDLMWNAPTNSSVAGYKIERSTNGGTSWSIISSNTNSTTTMYFDSGLQQHTMYYYRIAAVNQAGTSSSSEVSYATTFSTVSISPQNFQATVSSPNTINLNWTAPTNDGGSSITGYQIERSTDNGSTWSVLVQNTNSTSTTYSDTGLTPNTTYTYRVSAINSIGTGPPSNTASATTNTPEDAIIATIPVGSQPHSITVNLNTNRIYLVDGNGIEVIDGSTDTVVETIPAQVRQIAINPNTNLIYGLYGTHAVNVIDASTGQNVTSINTLANTGDIIVNPNTNKIYVTWTNWAINCPMGGVQIINGTTNTVDKSIGLGCNNPILQGVINPVTNKVYVFDQYDSGVKIIDGATDDFVGQIGGTHGDQMAINPITNMLYVKDGDSIQVADLSTNTVIKSILVGTNLSTIGVNPTTNKIYVGDWNGDGRGTTVYVIDGSSNTMSQSLVVGSGPSTIGVNPNTSKTYIGAQISNTVSVIGSNTHNPQSVPSDPQNLQVTSGNAQISLSWTSPINDGGSSITNYNIYRSTSSGTETFLVSVGNNLSYADNAVTNGQTYFYTVTAVNSVGESAQSNESSATPIAPATAPDTPTGLTVTTASSSQINLGWTAPNDGGSPITGYQIERSSDNGSSWSIIVSNTGSTSTTYSNTGLTANTTYTYRVSAINSIGISSPSNTASATTSNPTPSGITLNNVKSTSGAASGTVTISNFNSGSGGNKLLVVGVSANNNDVASITFGGVPLTAKAYSFYNNDAELWYLANPSSVGDIIVTMNGPTDVVVGAYSFSGVDQASPIPTKITKHNTTPNGPKVTITTKYANSLILDLPSIWGGVTLGSPTCANQWDLTVPDGITGASSSKMVPTPSVAGCNWSASSPDFWDDVAIELKAAE